MPAEFCLSGVLALSTLWETDIKDVGMQQGGVGIRKPHCARRGKRRDAAVLHTAWLIVGAQVFSTFLITWHSRQVRGASVLVPGGSGRLGGRPSERGRLRWSLSSGCCLFQVVDPFWKLP